MRIVGLQASILLGNRQPEAPQLGHAVNDVLGNQVVFPVDMLGHRPDLLLGEAPELAHDHRPVLVQTVVPGVPALAHGGCKSLDVARVQGVLDKRPDRVAVNRGGQQGTVHAPRART